MKEKRIRKSNYFSIRLTGNWVKIFSKIELLAEDRMQTENPLALALVQNFLFDKAPWLLIFHKKGG